MHVEGIFCDVKEASDCVNHDILLGTLHFVGIQETAVHLFGSYLTKRKQKWK